MKRDLYFRKPLMNAGGTLGFSPEPRLPLQWDELGAFITNPISLRPRLPAARPSLLEFPGGFLLHSGLPNPGFSAVLSREAARWARATLPVIVHLIADRPEDAATMVRRLEEQENVMAVELGFAPLLSDDILLLTLEMCTGELPIIVALSPEQAIRLGATLLMKGASAISLTAPRGALPLSASGTGTLVHGRLYGPALFPQMLETLLVLARLGVPTIGGGGVWKREQAKVLLDAGALAVQVDAALWLPSNFLLSSYLSDRIQK